MALRPPAQDFVQILLINQSIVVLFLIYINSLVDHIQIGYSFIQCFLFADNFALHNLYKNFTINNINKITLKIYLAFL